VLAEDRFVCMVARTHLFARRTPNVARFIEAKHALIAPHGTRFGVVDRAPGCGRRRWRCVPRSPRQAT
jgi:hypothetical protein